MAGLVFFAYFFRFFFPFFFPFPGLGDLLASPSVEGEIAINPSNQKKARASPREPFLNREDLGHQSTDHLDRQQSARC